MRQILLLDTETTGLDPATDQAIEVGAILYSVTHATVLESFASLIRAESNAAEKINRIPVEALRTAPTPDSVWSRIGSLAAGADGPFVAHNAEFDRGFVPVHIERLAPWVCSMDDLAWPKQTRSGLSLVALALEHDLGVATAHRAMADCDLIARLFTRARELGTDLEAMLQRGLRPKATFVALVSFDDRQQAKDAGFAWNTIVPNKWARRMPVEDAAALPFPTQQVV